MLNAQVQAPDRETLLGLRRHLSIVHHLPGRIRLRLAPCLWADAARWDDAGLRDSLQRLEGIRAVRVNKAVASVIIEYDPQLVPPQQWETLVHGEDMVAAEILERWLGRFSRVVHHDST
ncbi:MAG: hypothetical protein RMN53_17165 [Anaerolineae bacterium]|nr:hypothetical protein [Anaerolineae bacterium]